MLLLAPAVVFIFLAVHLGLAAGRVASYGIDPVVTSLAGRTKGSPNGWDVPLPVLRRASRSSPTDFRFPYWAGIRLLYGLRDGGGWEGAVRAGRELRLAVGRAPTVAEARFYLARADSWVGKYSSADVQAAAALELAPLQAGIVRRIALYFRNRYMDSRDDHLLDLAVRAAKLAGSGIGDLLGLPGLSFGEMNRLFDAAGLSAGERIERLESARRYDWAVRLARKTKDTGLLGRALQARGCELARARDWTAAVRDLEAARERLGASAFSSYAVLGEALFRVGKEKEGLAESGRALLETGGAEDVARRLSRAGMPAAALARFLEKAAAGKKRPHLDLEAARAWTVAGEAGRAEKLLRPITGDHDVGAEASYLLARVFVAEGERAKALAQARDAVRKDGSRRKYKRLLEELEGKTR